MRLREGKETAQDLIAGRVALLEGLSATVYHYTSDHSAAQMLKDDKFRLASSAGKQSDDAVADIENRLYYMSFTRSKLGSYTTGAPGAVILTVDGRKLNNNFKAQPVDYWQMGPQADEAEDRLFHTKPFILKASSYIKEIHLQVEPEGKQERWPGSVRDLIKHSKRRGIPLYMYDNSKSFILQAEKDRVTRDVKDLRVPKPNRGADFSSLSADRRKRDFGPVIELIEKLPGANLSKDTEKYLKDLHGYRNARGEMVRKLSTALGDTDARGSDILDRVVQYMQRHSLRLAKDLVDHLKIKWPEPK